VEARERPEEKRRRRGIRRIRRIRRIRKEDQDKALNGSGLCSKVCCNNLLTAYQISTAPSKVAPGTDV